MKPVILPPKFPGSKTLMLLASVFVLSSLHAQVVLSNPTCTGISQKECLIIHLKEAQIIFEGTVLNSRKYRDSLDHHLKISTQYRIEKIFKGDLPAGTVMSIADEAVLMPIYARWYELAHNEKLGEPNGLAVYEPGSTMLLLAATLGQDRIEGNPVITEINRVMALNYWLTDDVLLPESRKKGIIFQGKTPQDCIYYKKIGDLYALVCAVTGKRFIDCTHRKFKKKMKHKKYWRKYARAKRRYDRNHRH